MLLEAIPHADSGKKSASGGLGWTAVLLYIYFFQVAFENKKGEVFLFFF